MGSSQSLSVPAAPQGASKATQTEWNCPVCHSVHSNAEAVPCGHQFCLGCLLRHTAASPLCPLCASPVLSARFSLLGQGDFLQCILSPPAAPPEPGSGTRRALFRLVYTCPRPSEAQRAPAPAEPGCEGPQAVAGFPPDLWAELLDGEEHLLDPVRPWLRQSLDAIYGPRWWEAREVESITLSTLCICGPDRDLLTQTLQRYLREYTAPLVHGLIHVTMHQCRESWLLRRCDAARKEDESPAATAGPPALRQALGPDPAGPGVDDQPSTPDPTRAEDPGHPPSAPAPAEQDQPRGVPGEDTAAPGPSAPRRGRNRQRWGSRRPQRRKAHKCRRALKSRRRKPKRK